MDRHTEVEGIFPVDKPSEGIYVSVMRTGGRPEQLRVGEVGIHGRYSFASRTKEGSSIFRTRVHQQARIASSDCGRCDVTHHRRRISTRLSRT